MISLDEINDEIARLETSAETTYGVIQKLSWLYTVRNNVTETEKIEVAGENGKTDFLILANSKGCTKTLVVVDELVETMKTLHPRMYEAFMKKLYEA